MENRLLDYEQFISDEVADGNQSEELVEYHREMLANFQHERLIHLIITLFFAILAIAALAVSGLIIGSVPFSEWLPFTPIFAVALILSILTGFYVKHYYFLENHVQKLYDVSRKLVE